MKARVLGVSLAVAAAVVCGAASAQENRPCASDVEKFCPGKKPGTREAMVCLRPHMTELSAPCQARLGGGPAAGGRRRMGPIRAMLNNCKAELEKHCKGVQAGGGRYRDCLDKHEKDLSPQCKEALGQVKQAQKPQAKEEVKGAIPAATPPAAATQGAGEGAGKTPAK